MKTEYTHRYIDSSLCVGCSKCVTICPTNAIHLDDGKATIDPDECAECGVCTRARVCDSDGIKAVKLAWPRTLRALFSDPLAKHEGTQVYGRGTEETKTNDSQNLYPKGSMGVIIELGRPVLGVRLADVEKVVKKFASRGYCVPPQNPVMSLVQDPAVGSLKPEILQEKVISCLVEFILPETAAGELMDMIGELDREVDTVFNVCVGIPADDKGRPRLHEIFGPDVRSLPQVKVNLGMARGIS